MNLIGMFAFILYQIIRLFIWAVIIRVIVSWLVAFGVINPYNRFASGALRALDAVTEPVMAPVRRFLPSMGGLDLSPLIVIVVLQAVNIYLVVPLMVRGAF